MANILGDGMARPGELLGCQAQFRLTFFLFRFFGPLDRMSKWWTVPRQSVEGGQETGRE